MQPFAASRPTAVFERYPLSLSLSFSLSRNFNFRRNAGQNRETQRAALFYHLVGNGQLWRARAHLLYCSILRWLFRLVRK